MTVHQGLKGDLIIVYATAVSFARACPFLFAIPAVAEFLQHVVEVRIGFYASLAEAHALAANPWRLGFGFAKVLTILLPSYWFTRYVLFGRADRAVRIEWPALGLWLLLGVLSAALVAALLCLPSLVRLVGLHGKVAAIVIGLPGLAVQVLAIYWSVWFVAWPAGNVTLGPWRSMQIMSGHFWRSANIMLGGTIPLMALHYLLGYGAMGRSALVTWPMLAIDALATAFLALMISGSIAVAARRAAANKGLALV